MMNNVLALSVLLIIISIIHVSGAGKQQHQLKDDGVVIELEKEDGNTKVLISPPHHDDDKEDAKEKSSMDDHMKFSPRELVCDAYGKCKHKIASAMGKTKDTKESVEDKIKEKASHDTKEAVYEAKEKAKKAMGEGIGKVKDTFAKKEASSDTKESAQVSNVKETAKRWMCTVTGVLHLVGLATAYGMCVWITFGSSYVLAGALSVQQYGMVQSKIYPVYFKAMAFSVGMGLLGHLMSTGKKTPFSMAAALGMVLVNLLYLEPRATKVMFERMKKEKEEGRGKEGEPSGGIVEAETRATGTIGTTEGTSHEKPEGTKVVAPKSPRGWREILRRLNSYSSVLNVLTLMSLTWHLLHLAHHLHTCS